MSIRTTLVSSDDGIDFLKTRISERVGKVTTVDIVFGAYCNECDLLICDGLPLLHEALDAAKGHEHSPQPFPLQPQETGV